MNNLVKAKQQELLEKCERELPDFQAGKQRVFGLLLSMIIMSAVALIGATFYYATIHYLFAIFFLFISAISMGIFLFWGYLIYYRGQKAVVYLLLAGGIFSFFYTLIFYMPILVDSGESGLVIMGLLSMFLTMLQICLEILLVCGYKCRIYLEVMSKIKKEAMLAVRRE